MIVTIKDKKSGLVQAFANVESLGNPYTEESGKVGYLEIRQKDRATTTILNIKDFDITINEYKQLNREEAYNILRTEHREELNGLELYPDNGFINGYNDVVIVFNAYDRINNIKYHGYKEGQTLELEEIE